MNAAMLPRIDEPAGRALGQPVLRILSGRLAGKAFPLDGRTRLSIGHGFVNDVVLRGAGTRDCSVELWFNDDTAALNVVTGQIELLGRALAAGERAILPHYLPFRLGEYLVAHGARLSPRWEDAQVMADVPPGTPIEQLQPPSLTDRLLDKARSWIGRIDGRGLRLTLALGSLALLAMAVAEPLGRMIAERTTNIRALAQELRQAGFPGVTVAQTPGGTLMITGVVRDEEELSRLRALARQRDPSALVDAQTGPALASAAADILQAQGVVARIVPASPGVLAITAGYMPADRQDRLRTLLRQDMPAIRQVHFRVDDGLSASPLQAFFTRSGAGLATVVDSPAHIVTADGSRWFPGATLPTGHRLISVTPTAVVFAKDGRTEHINL